MPNNMRADQTRNLSVSNKVLGTNSGQNKKPLTIITVITQITFRTKYGY